MPEEQTGQPNTSPQTPSSDNSIENPSDGYIPSVPENGQPQSPQAPSDKLPETSEKSKEVQIKEAQKKLFGIEDSSQPQKQSDDSFTKIDINKLPEELKPMAETLRADFQRKMDELKNQKGTVNESDRQQVLGKALDSLTDQEFELATQHPVFVNRLMSYLNRQGYQPGQNQPQQKEDNQNSLGLTEDELELADPLTRKLYEQNQQMSEIIKDLKGRVDNTDVATRNAAIQAEDARLQGKYHGIYDPSRVNTFLSDVQSGRQQLSRELIFKALDYDNATKRWYGWGKEESYSETPNQGNASMLSGIQSGNDKPGYEAPKIQKGENRLSYFQRLFDSAKQKVANGEKSPYQRNT